MRPEQVEFTPSSDQGQTPATVVAELMTQEPAMVSAEPFPIDESIQNEMERLRELERQPVIQAQVVSSPAPVDDDEAPAAAHGTKRRIIIVIIIACLLVVVGLVVVPVVVTREQPTEIHANEPTASPTTDAPVVQPPTPGPTTIPASPTDAPVVQPPTPGPTTIAPLCNLVVNVECFIAGNSSQTCDNYTVVPEASPIFQVVEIMITFAADNFFTLLSFDFGGSNLSDQVAGEVVEPGSSVVVNVEATIDWSVRQTYTFSIEVRYELLPSNASVCSYFGNATFVAGNPPQ